MHALLKERLLVAALAAALAPAAVAAVMPVPVQQRWTGRVPAGVAPPPQSSLVTAEALQVVWTLCQVQAPMPAIDFGRELVVLAVRKGTTVRFQNAQLVDGNLRTNVVVQPAPPAQMHCALARVAATGVKTVNGVPLGQ